MEAPPSPRLASHSYVDEAWHSGSKSIKGQPALHLGVAASSPPNGVAVPERKQKEKTKSKKPWAGRLILGVAAAVGVVIVGASILRSAIGDSVDQEEEDEKNDPRKKTTMKAPGSGGQIISRDEFVKNPKEYFSTKRVNLKDAVDRFQ